MINYLKIGGVIFPSFFLLSIIGQTKNIYPSLFQKKKWSLSIGYNIFEKGEITKQNGDYHITNHVLNSYSIGAEYDIFPHKKTSIILGVLLSGEPAYKISYTINKNDIYSHFTDDLDNQEKGNAIVPSYSIPILSRLNLKLSENTFLNGVLGIRVKYLAYGIIENSNIIWNENKTESREVFSLNLSSNKKIIQGGLIFGTGVSFELKKFTLQPNLRYFINFNDTFSGEYKFGNLLTSSPSKGSYKLTGNHISISLSIGLKQKLITKSKLH